MAKSKAFPKSIIVYQVDEVDGVAVYAVATDTDDIELDMNGEKVGIYRLEKTCTFSVHREIK